MTNSPNPQRRRALMLLGGFAGFAALTQLIPRWIDRVDGQFDFVELDTPAGFRTIKQGEQSVFVDPFIGLDTGADDIPKVAIPDLDAALFYARNGADRVQLAYFSDLYCPYCRVLSQHIIALSTELPIDISWQDRPIFGTASTLAAQGQIAAGQQGGYVAFHQALSKTPVQVTRPFLTQLADRQGLDVARFKADFDSPETQQALGRARTLASLFGFVGTPAMVIGRTIVEGQISRTNLRQLIDLERAAL